MDMSQNISAKKQRNPRNQRDRKKVQEKEAESPNSSESVCSTVGSNPQPQRTNRRQRNDTAVNKISTENSPPVVETEKKETVVNVVDHSNLKRETEEIAKLKKKFTKREITSNWHRYEATEKGIDIEQPEEDAPANFSELLRVPVSRGGHLQLKEEQDWSTATGSELSGYFALDLKLLSQSLACIPLYERLRLPKNLLIEEEIQYFDALANEAKLCYNQENIKDPNVNPPKLSNLVYIKNDIEKGEETKMYNTEDSLNLLNIEGSKKKVMDVKSETWCSKPLEQSFEIKENEVNSQQHNIIPEQILNLNEEVVAVEIKLGVQENNAKLVESKNDRPLNIEIVQRLEDNTSEKIDSKKSPEKELALSNKNICGDKFYENVEKINENLALGDTNVLKEENKLLIGTQPPNNETRVEQNIINKEKHNNSEPKQITSKKNNSKKPPMEEVAKKELNKTKNINLDEDDDLDFLLSLKQPVPTHNKKKGKPAAVKDSSFMPGGVVETQTTTQETHSELDDWLDSVLQD